MLLRDVVRSKDARARDAVEALLVVIGLSPD